MAILGEFERLLPENIRSRSRLFGEECAIPYPEVLQAIDFATSNSIAVLGVETFTPEADGIRVEGESRYDFPVTEWLTFVDRNNRAAKDYIAQIKNASDFVYILTNASKEEFQSLTDAVDRPNS